MLFRLLPGPVADGSYDHLRLGEGLGGEGVQKFAQMTLGIGAVDDDTQPWLHVASLFFRRPRRQYW